MGHLKRYRVFYTTPIDRSLTCYFDNVIPYPYGMLPILLERYLCCRGSKGSQGSLHVRISLLRPSLETVVDSGWTPQKGWQVMFLVQIETVAMIPMLVLIYIYIGLIQNIWIHIWCLTSCGVRSASARAFNTCACEVREQRQARARDARANTGARAGGARARPRGARANTRARPTRARANKLSARANKLSKSQISSPNPLLESLFARARVGRMRARTRAHILALLAHLARAPLFARASRARACLCLRTSRAHVLNARAPARARFQQEMFHMF